MEIGVRFVLRAAALRHREGCHLLMALVVPSENSSGGAASRPCATAARMTTSRPAGIRNPSRNRSFEHGSADQMTSDRRGLSVSQCLFHDFVAFLDVAIVARCHR